MFMQKFVCPVHIISGLDDHSKFQMSTVFSGRHIGVPRRYTMQYATDFDECLKFGVAHRPKNWRNYFFTSLL